MPWIYPSPHLRDPSKVTAQPLSIKPVGQLHPIVVHAVIAHSVPHAAAAFCVKRTGGDVDSAAYRGG